MDCRKHERALIGQHWTSFNGSTLDGRKFVVSLDGEGVMGGEDFSNLPQLLSVEVTDGSRPSD